MVYALGVDDATHSDFHAAVVAANATVPFPVKKLRDLIGREVGWFSPLPAGQACCVHGSLMAPLGRGFFFFLVFVPTKCGRPIFRAWPAMISALIVIVLVAVPAFL